MNTLRVKDNSPPIIKTEFAGIADLAGRLAGKTLGRLEQEGMFVFTGTLGSKDGVRPEDIPLADDGANYRTGNLMGYFGYDDQQLIIESRFSGSNGDFFSAYMLDRVLCLPDLTNLVVGNSTRTSVFDLLMFLFPVCLKSALRKGLYKEYRHCSCNDDNVCGIINIDRHIRQNTPFVGNIAYDRREFSADNAITELIRHTIEFLKGSVTGRAVLGHAKDEVQIITMATGSYKAGNRDRVIAYNRAKPVSHAFYREYRALQQLCMHIIRHRHHNMGSGPQRMFGIVFDAAWLWEEYVYTLLKDYFHHPRNRAGVGSHDLLSGTSSKIYPDFISKDPDRRVIADAKYKYIDNISGNDYKQILAYMFRFDAKTGLFLYPSANASDMREMKLMQGSAYENNVRQRDDISVIKYGIGIPSDEESYARFEECMQESEDELREYLAGMILHGKSGNCHAAPVA